MPKIAIVAGSKTDEPLVKKSVAVLDKLGMEYETGYFSAHRAPDKLMEYVKSAPTRGVEVFIAIAGLAAHLPGFLAAHSPLPVIGVPAGGGPLAGVDALLSIVQMPKGVPVATMGIGSHGAQNAALFAMRILALEYPDVRERLASFIAELNEG